MLRTKDPAPEPDEACAGCGEPVEEGLVERCEFCAAERDAAEDSARLAMELAQRLGTTPALRRVFAATVKRARAVLAGGRA